jgi:hypothetical protein
LDLEVQARLAADGEAQLEAVRDAVAMESLTEEYLRHIIKRDCWDAMAVVGRTLFAHL